MLLLRFQLVLFLILCWGAPSEAQSRRTLTGHTQPVRSVAIGKDGTSLASGSFDGTVRSWDLLTGKELKSWNPHKGTVYSVSFSPDGKLLASAGNDEAAVVRLWDVRTWGEIAALKDSPNGAWKVAFSPDGSLLLSLSKRKVDQREVGVATLWDVATRTKKGVIEGDTIFVGDAQFSPDSKMLATASADGFIHLWDIPSGKKRRSIDADTKGIHALVFDPEGKSLAAAVDNATTKYAEVRFWDLATGKHYNTIQPRYMGGISMSIALTPDGKSLVIGSRPLLEVWDLKPLKLRALLEGHKLGITCVQCSQDGKTLITGSRDGTIRVWDFPEPMDD